MGGDAALMIRHNGKARQRVVQETSTEEWRHTLEGSFSQVEWQLQMIDMGKLDESAKRLATTR
jgi:hypothetical protein